MIMNIDDNYCLRLAESYRLFRRIGSSDELLRNCALKGIVQNIDAWYMGFGSPNGHLENSFDSCSSTTIDSEMHYLIDQLVPDLIRLSITAPYEDVREHCLSILTSLDNKSFNIPRPKFTGASYFIPNSEFENMWNNSEDSNFLQGMIFEYFEEWKRVENYIVVMGLHPNYLEQYIKLYNHLFTRDGSLPYKERFYLAIMAAAQIHNRDLINRFIAEFISCQGDTEWLQGLHKAPGRLQAIAILGQYLIHQPWQIEPKNIEGLIRGPNNSFHISMTQLMQAIVIMTHISSLGCFIFATGVANEIDHSREFIRTANHNSNISDLLEDDDSTTDTNASSPIKIPNKNNNQSKYPNHRTSSDHISNNSTNYPITKPFSIYSNSVAAIGQNNDKSQSDDEMTGDSNIGANSNNVFHKFIDHNRFSMSEDDSSSGNENKDCPIEVLMERMQTALNDDIENAIDVEKMFADVEKVNETIVKNANHPTRIDSLSERFLHSKNFGYSNFNSSQCPVLRIQDYSWRNQACRLADWFYPEVGCALEDKFNCSYELTYNTMGDNTNIDTSLFRLSVWIYVHSLYGIRHDDYNYSQLDSLLTQPLRSYIKKTVTRPCTVTKDDFLKFMPQLKYSEKIHIALMVADARQQACLLHVLNAMKSVHK